MKLYLNWELSARKGLAWGFVEQVFNNYICLFVLQSLECGVACRGGWIIGELFVSVAKQKLEN